jgi:hypothetical protein
MRHVNVIMLDENRTVTVQELRVKDVRQLLSRVTDLDKLDMTALLGQRFTELSKLLEPFIEFPQGESLDDLCGSELQQVLDGFKQVNAPFLILAGLEPAVAKPEPKRLTEPAVN